MFTKILNKLTETLERIRDKNIEHQNYNREDYYGVKNFSPTLDEAAKFLRFNSISAFLPYLSYDAQSELFINKNSVGFVIETPTLVGATADIQNELISLFENILPLNSNLQIMLLATNKVSLQIVQWYNTRTDATEVLKGAAKKRKEFFKAKAQENSCRNFRVIISYSEEGNSLEYIRKEELITIKKQIVGLFSSLGLVTKVWDAKDLINTLDEIININDSIIPATLKYNPLDSISDQIVSPSTQITLEKDVIYQHNRECAVKSYQVRKYPNAWSLAAMNELIGDSQRDLLQIQCNFIIQLGIHIVKDDTLKTRMLAKSLRVESQLETPFVKFMPNLINEIEEWRFVRKQFEQGSRVVKTNYQVSLFGKSEDIAKSEQVLLSLYRANAWELEPSYFIQLPCYLSIMPMSFAEGIVKDMSVFKKMKTTLSHEPANLMPLQGEWQGTKTPGLMLTGRRGQLFYWYPFDNETGNYNVCVVGKSGSGKSVFMQELVTSTLSIGGRVFVLDVGRSFEKLAHLYEGKFIEFTTNKPICINPFSTIQDNFSTEEIQNSLTMIKQTISMMAAPIKGTDDMENSIIEKAVFSAWDKKKQEADIDAVVAELQEIGNRKVNKKAYDLATQLYPFTSKGIYGAFFNGKAGLTFKEKLIVIEFEELRQKKDLQNVVLQIVILQVTNQMILGERQKLPFNIVLDEAWDMLKGGKSGDFIEMLARTLRKFNGSLVVGTQSVDNFYLSPAAQAAFQNSDWMCLLSQKQESINRLKESKRLAMSDHMENNLRNLRTKQGEYAEVMICGMGGYAIGRLFLDPFSKILYSTKATEVAELKKLTAQGHTVEEAIEIMVKGGNYETKASR
jgi:conjugal transfer ATP-binding protein TraC